MANININNNGLLPKIWGPHMWVALHSITFNYPVTPTSEDKETYKVFFQSLGHVLPCSYCASSYKDFISHGLTQLTDDVLETRDSLTKWLYYVHEAVNKKLGIDYGITYDNVVERYESYRAACDHQQDNKLIKMCDTTADKKTIPFNVAIVKDCPVIPIKIAKRFIKYAKMRGLEETEFYIINNPEATKNNAIWKRRNIECEEIINRMRLKGINSVETSDEWWKGLPTIDELRLIMRLSSNLTKNKLIALINKLPGCQCQFEQIYKLTK